MIKNILHNLLIEHLLLETVGRNKIIEAMQDFRSVLIYYSGDHIIKKGWRTIYPFVYGKNRWGNDSLRAFQIRGPSDSADLPRWRMFRIDRIKSWNTTVTKFNFNSHEDILKYYNAADKDMQQIYYAIKPPRDSDRYSRVSPILKPK